MLQSQCSSGGSCDLTSNSASPCLEKIFCLECKVAGHTYYSVKCPNNNCQLAKPRYDMDLSTTAQALLSWNINGRLLVIFPVIKGLFSYCGVLCLQEHYLTSHNLGLLKIENNFAINSLPAKRSASSDHSWVVLRCLLRPCAGQVFFIHVIFS